MKIQDSYHSLLEPQHFVSGSDTEAGIKHSGWFPDRPIPPEMKEKLLVTTHVAAQLLSSGVSKERAKAGMKWKSREGWSLHSDG